MKPFLCNTTPLQRLNSGSRRLNLINFSILLVFCGNNMTTQRMLFLLFSYLSLVSIVTSELDRSKCGMCKILICRELRLKIASKTHWDFLTKFLSFHYYTTLEGVLVVQRSRQAQGTIICLTYKNYKNPLKSYCFLGYCQSLLNFGWKTAAQTN